MAAYMSMEQRDRLLKRLARIPRFADKVEKMLKRPRLRSEWEAQEFEEHINAAFFHLRIAASLDDLLCDEE